MPAEINVAYVTKEVTPGPVDKLAEKFDFGHGGGAETDIARRVLDQVTAAQAVLDLGKVITDRVQCLRVVGQRQQVVQILAVVGGPRQVAGDEDRINAVDQRPHALQMEMVDAAGAPDREADRVHRDRVVTRQVEQKLGGMRIGEKVLGMDFKPGRGRPGGHDLGKMRKPQADT